VGAVTPLDGRSVDDRAARLAGDLRTRGRITDPQWEQALREVPRHLFAPTAAWSVPNHESAPRGRIELTADPAAYLDAIYSDASIIIQADDGAGDASSGKGAFTSSISAPGIVFPFLELLAPQKGDRVLEIGTGSGWTAGLLSWAIGQDGVTSVEVDSKVATRASANLMATGLAPHVVVGDGLKGYPERAPFDRMHVTVGVTDIPRAWISQTRPGGIVVMPWQPNVGLGYMLRLTVTSENAAVGSFHGPASYMMVRSQRQGSKWNPHHAEKAGQSTTRLHPRTVATAGLGARLLMAAYAPRVDWHVMDENGTFSLLLFETTDPDGSWAACDIKPGNDLCQVTQFGKRRLWKAVSDAYLQWVSLGSPSYERFGLTVQPDGMKLWLDHSQGPSWDLHT
jgi:protein-L-isoaspartate(D-aspartate) O-methyltransferase